VSIDGIHLPGEKLGVLLRPGDGLELALPFPFRTSAVAAVTSLGDSLQLGQDAAVLRIDLIGADGGSQTVWWRAGVQRELGRNMAIEVAYVGTYSDDVDVSSFLGNTNNTQASVRQDILPSQYWNHTDTRNAALATENNRNVPNPFFVGNLTALRASNPALYNQLAAQALFTSPTIQKNRLLRPYPHMSVGNGLQALALIRQEHPAVNVAMLSGFGDTSEVAQRALAMGAIGYIQKNGRLLGIPEQLRVMTDSAAAQRRARQRREQLRSAASTPPAGNGS